MTRHRRRPPVAAAATLLATVRNKPDTTGCAAARLHKKPGRSFGDAWRSIDRLATPASNPPEAGVGRSEGAPPPARPQTVPDAAKAKPDHASRPVFDPHTVVPNNVVVMSRSSVPRAARDLMTASGADASVVSSAATTEAPRPLYHVRGANAYRGRSGSWYPAGLSVHGSADAARTLTPP